jgi:hypothetical protein
LIDLGPIDLGVELPVEVFQRLEIGELGQLFAPLQASLGANVEFVLEEQFEELAVGKAVGGGLLEAEFQSSSQAGKAQLATGREEGIRHGFG